MRRSRGFCLLDTRSCSAATDERSESSLGPRRGRRRYVTGWRANSLQADELKVSRTLRRFAQIPLLPERHSARSQATREVPNQPPDTISSTLFANVSAYVW
jgi:hypothetical protein